MDFFLDFFPSPRCGVLKNTKTKRVHAWKCTDEHSEKAKKHYRQVLATQKPETDKRGKNEKKGSKLFSWSARLKTQENTTKTKRMHA
jgi:hypothetical protein